MHNEHKQKHYEPVLLFVFADNELIMQLLNETVLFSTVYKRFTGLAPFLEASWLQLCMNTCTALTLR